MSVLVKKHLSILGKKVKDKVTGFSGVAESLSFDLYGCVQVAIRPPVDERGETKEGRWHDISRLDIVDEVPVMDVPNFEYGDQAEGRQGCSDKPRLF